MEQPTNAQIEKAQSIVDELTAHCESCGIGLVVFLHMSDDDVRIESVEGEDPVQFMVLSILNSAMELYPDIIPAAEFVIQDFRSQGKE